MFYKYNFQKKVYWHLVFIISIFIPLPVQGQVVPKKRSPQGQTTTTEFLQPLPPTVPLQEKIPRTITIKKFLVTGSTVFSAEDFAKITKPYTNRPLSLTELFELRSKITNLYVKNGYITSGAYIPPQKLQNGVIEIRVVEGGLEQIKVTGTRRIHPDYIRSRVAIATKKPLRRQRLLEALQLLQLNPLIKNIKAELSAGVSPGQSVLEVHIVEADTFKVQVISDNGRSPAVGSFRRQIQLEEGNVTGWGDRAIATYSNTDGSNAFDFSYSLPINARNGTLFFNYSTSHSHVIEKPFNILDIQSSYNYYELTFRQPIIQKPNREFALGLTLTHQQSQASFLNGELPFPGSGADKQGRTTVTMVRLFQEWTSSNSKQVFTVRSALSAGLDLWNATINANPPDGRFVSWRGQLQWARLLAPDTLLLLRGDIQLADRPLVPFEQFGLGGQDSVRGYRQDALLADNGIFASAEVRIPLVRLGKRNSVLQLTPFIDFGNAWNRSGSKFKLNTNTLASVGLGLRLQIEDRLNARFDWGIPLVSISEEKDSWQENGLYFSIVVNPF